MIVLDTDHISLLQQRHSPVGQALKQRLDESGDPDIFVTIVSAEEQMRGWLALINRYQDVRRQITYYVRLEEFLRFYADWNILQVDQAAAERVRQLRKVGIQIGASDLKIASIALVFDALLLTRNFRHFSRVPGLRFADWSTPQGRVE